MQQLSFTGSLFIFCGRGGNIIHIIFSLAYEHHDPRDLNYRVQSLQPYIASIICFYLHIIISLVGFSQGGSSNFQSMFRLQTQIYIRGTLA